jgi:Holliday junction DNA helicase RuvA
MIAHINGKVSSKTSTEVVIDCNGVGYLINIPVSTSESIPDSGNEVFLKTYMITKEDSMTLYGFHSEGEREAFKLLISVSGIGPKIALGILSSVSFDELHDYIIQKNIPALQKLPGIGKKTAERLSLELADKIINLGVYFDSTPSVHSNVAKSEALSALIALGYSNSLAEKYIKSALKDSVADISAEELIRKALNKAMT